jgi:dipeptidyl aminopeptidase/acylaminoacyl peptidase
MRKLLTIVSFLWLLPVALAQESKPLAEAGITTCESPDSGGGRGKWATSKAGFSAAVELRAKVTGTNKQRRCVTSWKLHIRDDDKQPKSIVVAEREDRPDDNEWGQENSFEINGWSRDGKMVLLSQIEAQGDWDETTPIIYDFQSKRHWRIELYPLFKKLIPADCYVVYRPIRFANDERVLVSASSTDTDREPGTKPCFKDSLWQLNFRHNSIAPLAISR